MTESSFIRNPHLDGDTFFWQGNQIGVLLIHGFTATTAEVRLIAEKLHAVGYTTAAPLLAGHGTHPDELNQTRWQAWYQSVKQQYQQRLLDHKPIFIIAESMGTLLALKLAAEFPKTAGLLLFAPAIKIPGLWRAPLMAPFINHLQKSGEDDGLPWKGYTVYPVKAAAEMLKLQKHVRRLLPKIKTPTLIFTGEHDQSIDPKAAEIILDAIGSDEKSHIHMADSPHCILLAHELDQVFTEVQDFIDNHLPEK